jgi:hypothetical protein
MCTDCNVIRTIVLERDLAAKCWTRRFSGFDQFPTCKVPLPYASDSDLFAIAYALRDRHGDVAIINQEPDGGRRYAVQFAETPMRSPMSV